MKVHIPQNNCVCKNNMLDNCFTSFMTCTVHMSLHIVHCAPGMHGLCIHTVVMSHYYTCTSYLYLHTCRSQSKILIVLDCTYELETAVHSMPFCSGSADFFMYFIPLSSPPPLSLYCLHSLFPLSLSPSLPLLPPSLPPSFISAAHGFCSQLCKQQLGQGGSVQCRERDTDWPAARGTRSNGLHLHWGWECVSGD